MKYVVVKTEFDDLVPIIFPETIPHRTIPKESYNHTAVSAGFCALKQGKWVAYGESIGLKLKSRPEDTDLLNRHFSDTDTKHEVEHLKAHVFGMLQIIELMNNNALPKDYATLNNLQHWIDSARKAANGNCIQKDTPTKT